MSRRPLSNLAQHARWSVLAVCLGLTPALAADDDALDLQAEPTKTVPTAGARPVKVSLEVSAIDVERRHQNNGAESGHRASIDLRWQPRLGDEWRGVVSLRADDMQPVLPGQRSSRLHVREALVTWAASDDRRTLELGRLNLRHGPTFGYNPTDYFRRGATRSIVTADPVALRENRVGTFLIRGSQLLDSGSISLTWAPQLTSRPPSDTPVSLDLGATNGRDRWLLSLNRKLSDRWSAEALLLAERDASTRIGLSFTGLVSDAIVANGEWSTQKSESLLDQALSSPGQQLRRHQASLGLTGTLPGEISLTAEFSMNTAGLDRGDWMTLFTQSSPATLTTFFNGVQADQELAARRAWLLYATKKSVFGLKALELTAFLRHSAVDHSGMAWAELRYRLPKVDIALQSQHVLAKSGSEYFAIPFRRVTQLLLVMHL